MLISVLFLLMKTQKKSKIVYIQEKKKKMTLRRGVGVGAITNKSNLESMSKKLSEQRLDDISKSVEMLEEGIRKFIEANKEEIRNNEFLRDKIKTLAASCNVDLGAATSTTGRLKPGLLSSLLGDALRIGTGSSETESASMKKFYDFLSSRLITTCMRERVLRGPVIPLSVVLNDLRKRYPLEEITLHDIVKSVEHLKPLNPNLFILEQQQEQQEKETAAEKEFVAGGDPSNFFIAFQPLSISSSNTKSSLGKNTNNTNKIIDATASGTDAIRIIVLANELAKLRRKELIEKFKKMSSNNSDSPSSASFALTKTGISPVTRFASSSTTTNSSNSVFPSTSTNTNSTLLLQLQQEFGLVEGDQPGSVFIRLTPADVVSSLSTRNFATTTTTDLNKNNKTSSKSIVTKSSNNNRVWTGSRARLSLKAARELCEGWWDSVDNSTWLMVVVVA